MDVQVKFLGGAGTVTGSRYLLDIGNFRMLFDCGLFQGLKELRVKNWDEFPVDPATIHVVVISHAHIDHTGYLPRLVQEGFSGDIYCTAPTADLMKIMLMDSAKLQEEEASYAAHKGYSKHTEPKPLYTAQDAGHVFPLIKTYNYNETIRIDKCADIIFRDAGHLLGSAITELFIHGDRHDKKIVFSGDLGRYQDPILNEPAAIEQTDVLFIESTYGDKASPAYDPEGDLQRIVNETFQRKGIVLIPAFAVGRTQLLLYYLRKLMREDRIPDVPVYIDSPMAISATYLYTSFPQYHKVNFSLPQLAESLETNMIVFVKTVQHSKALNDLKTNAIIISSSGMMTGGRILHHLYHRLPREQDTLLISGYQAAGTRGRDLVDKKASIRIFGTEVPVNCKIENVKSLSGHADHDELFRWMKNFKTKPKMVFTVHGEEPGLTNYANNIRQQYQWNVIIPQYRESVLLFDGI
ncbi:MBL fold metallo-hydrolase [Ohtaekwangia sp.]|uniref:MBL fold metallo-hydrolase n=1 Tax=Ohtaekwangia sp. TaxID=2066019 RepID=UPI002FDCD5BD